MDYAPAYRAALALLATATLGACTTPEPQIARAGVVLVEAREMPACRAEYSAVLDLAALARSYGPGAAVFLEALSTQMDQLDTCLGARGTQGPQAARLTLAARQNLIRP